MIRQIEIANFQSLRKLVVRLGQFTVITGPTGSGKSGFIRAIKLAAFNARGTSYITRGEKSCSVSVAGDEIEHTGMDDRWSAVIQRGSRNAYQLSVGINQKTYTKLEGKVPDPVAEVMRLGEINFAGQWDNPYLLDTTGSEVARVLGKLTNVTLLYRAAQEANRRRLASAQLLKTRQDDLARLQSESAQYADLPSEGDRVLAAEASLARLSALQSRQVRLGQLMGKYEMAVAQVPLPPPVPPSLDRLNALAATRARLHELTRNFANSMLNRTAARGSETIAAESAESCRQDLRDYEAQWDICPQCGQPVHKTPH